MDLSRYRGLQVTHPALRIGDSPVISIERNLILLALEEAAVEQHNQTSFPHRGNDQQNLRVRLRNLHRLSIQINDVLPISRRRTYMYFKVHIYMHLNILLRWRTAPPT